MNKAGLISSVASKLGVNQSEASAHLNAILETVCECLESGEKLVIANFGAFEVKKRAPSIARNLHTGEPINIGESKSVAFKPAKALKLKVSAGGEADDEE